MKKNKVKIPFNKPFIVGKELYNIAQAVLDSHLSGDGPFTMRCHKWLEEQLGCTKALLTHSCTGALEMAAILSGIEPGDEVIMPSFTFVSTANAFVLRGAIPIFVDIRSDTLNIDENKIEQAITSKTKAIVPVHYAGAPCEIDRIMQIADFYSLLVVEDAAQALLSKYKNRFLGTIGDFGCLSFHETKNIISGEGGAIIVNDAKFVERAKIIWEKGTDRSKFLEGKVDKYSWVDIGSSFYPSELVGAFLFAQFEQADKINSTRCKIYMHYYNRLEPLEVKGYLQRPCIDPESYCNGHMFYIITRTHNERDSMMRYLNASGINSVFHYVPLHSSLAGRKFGKSQGALDITDSISKRLLRLPLYYDLKIKDVDFVINKIFEFYENQ